jgi:large subunit ribosomal protein L32e
MKVLLEIRKKVKARKPTFLRTDSNRKKYKNNWRKPRGLHNKRRLNVKGHQKNPSQGYRSPLEVRGLNRSGFELINVCNITELNGIKKETQMVEIATAVGIKNKVKILEECKLKGLQISNVKDIDKFITEVKTKLELNKKQKTKKEETKKKAKASSIKKAEDKKKEEESKETQEEVKEEILKSKPKEEKHKEQTKQKDTTSQKEGHQHSSVPGTKQ